MRIEDRMGEDGAVTLPSASEIADGAGSIDMGARTPVAAEIANSTASTSASVYVSSKVTPTGVPPA